MVSRLITSAVLANFIVNGFALQLPQEGVMDLTLDEKICGKEQTPYEAISPLYPGVCSVFCVPAGACEGRVQTGQYKYLGITGQGNCKGSGYTASAALGNVTRETVDWLKTLQGPCKGMTLSKFEKPVAAKQKMFVDGGSCGKERAPYIAINPMFPDVCSSYCVPAGACEGQAQMGKLSYLGITERGDCKSKGFTESAPVGILAQETSDWLKYLQGGCKGMTFEKFQRPADAQPPADVEQKMFIEDRVCGKGQAPYEAISPMYPGVCSVFCVPEGECEGRVQIGQFKYLGISGSGNCKGSGFTQVAELGNVTRETVDWLKTLQGSCKGMTLSKFQKPSSK